MNVCSCKTKRWRGTLALLLTITLFPTRSQAAPQQDAEQALAAQKAAEEQARQAEERRQAEEYAARKAKEDQQRVESMMRDFLKDSREIIDAANQESEKRKTVLHRAQIQQFTEAFRTYETARLEISESMGEKTIPKDSMKKIEKSTAVFLDFIKQRSNTKRGSVDGKEFRDYSEKELRWEMLSTAERLSPPLGAILRSETAETVELGVLISLSKIEVELLRLQWLMKKVK